MMFYVCSLTRRVIWAIDVRRLAVNILYSNHLVKRYSRG